MPFVLSYGPSHLPPPPPIDPEKALAATETFWSDWISRAQGAGEWSVIARRVGVIDYAVYGASRRRSLPWITYDPRLSHLPHVRWMAKAVGSDREAMASVVVNYSELALNAVRAGLGRSLLPCRIGDVVRELSRLSGAKPVLSREVWLIVHPDLKHLARIRAVIEWCDQLFSEHRA